MRKETEARSLLLYGGVLLAALFLFTGGTRTAYAATDFSNGSLIKGTPSAVYFVNAEGKRMAFPNEATYFSWYNDFSTVKTVSDDEIAALPLSGLVTLKPGLSPVKVISDDKIYAVAHGGVLRELQSPEIAAMIFGSDWEKKIVSIPSAFYTSYTNGEAVTGAGQYWWRQEKEKSPDISADRDMSPVAVAAKVSTGSTPTEGSGSGNAVHESDKTDFSANVYVHLTDAKGNPALNMRRLQADFTKPADIPTITITEKTSGAVLVSAEMARMLPTKTVFDYTTPILKQKTTYLWKISAAELDAPAGTKKTENAGEFTTSDFEDGVDTYKITNVMVFKYDDGSGANGEDARGIVAKFSEPPKSAKITLTETGSGTVIGSETSDENSGGMKEFAAIPDNWKSKLKPNTAYSWMVMADFDKVSGGEITDIKIGEFTTSNFTTSNNTAVAAAPAGVFAINSVDVLKQDSKGRPAEDTRSFRVSFSSPPSDVEISVTRKDAFSATYYADLESNAKTDTSYVIGPEEDAEKLKPGTTYRWIAKAMAQYDGDLTDDELADKGLMAIYIGEFTTATSF